MNNETIIIKITTVEESVKVSELTEREKIIHQHGYELGKECGMKMWPGIVIAICVALSYTFLVFKIF